MNLLMRWKLIYIILICINIFRQINFNIFLNIYVNNQYIFINYLNSYVQNIIRLEIENKVKMDELKQQIYIMLKFFND